MNARNITRMRNLAATLLTLSGIGHIAALWFRDISETALFGASFGALYLIIGIGMFGQSRLSLFLGTIVPAAYAWFALSNTAIDTVVLIQLGTAFAVIVFSFTVLLAVQGITAEGAK